jgi:hypothetical protein
VRVRRRARRQLPKISKRSCYSLAGSGEGPAPVSELRYCKKTLESALSVATNASTTKWSDLSVVEDHR